MEESSSSHAISPKDLYIPCAFALGKIVLHLVFLGRYGIFRDEFYYLACARHLDWGYVDHPPLSLALLAAWTDLFGDGMLALRLPAILAGALTVLLTGVIARELGGGRFSQALACLAVLIAPLYLAIANFYSMNVFDQLVWTLLAWIVIRYLNSSQEKHWILFGLVAGIGLENKISVLFFGFGIVVALLLTAHRRLLLKKELWIGGALAGLLFLPYVAWQFTHDFATLEFMHNAATMKNLPMTPLQFFLGTLLEMHPLNAVVWLAGLGFALFHTKGKKYRLLGLTFLVVFFTFALTNGKVYYLSPIMPMMLALGAVAWEHWTRRALKWRIALVVPMAALGVALLPMSLPALSPETFVRYQQRIGIAPAQAERGAASVLPQHFADRFGWRDYAEFIEIHYEAIGSPPITMVVRNYGQAGALEYYASELDLPRVVCGHNNYYLWGPGDFTTDEFLAYGIEREALESLCDSVEEIGRFTQTHGMPHENNQPLFHCKGLKKSIEKVWPLLKLHI